MHRALTVIAFHGSSALVGLACALVVLAVLGIYPLSGATRHAASVTPVSAAPVATPTPTATPEPATTPEAVPAAPEQVFPAPAPRPAPQAPTGVPATPTPRTCVPFGFTYNQSTSIPPNQRWVDWSCSDGHTYSLPPGQHP